MKMKEYKLGELIDVTRGASLKSEYFSKDGSLLRITLANFDYRNNVFKDDTSKQNLFYAGSVKDDFILKKGDIITPLTEQTYGLLGSTARIPLSNKYIQSQDVGLIKCSNLLDNKFAYYLVSSNTVRKQISSMAQQTKIRHTSPDKIKSCTVVIPEDIDIQHKIGTYLNIIDERIALNNKLIKKLEDMIQYIYDYWFVQFDFPNEKGKPYKSSGGKMLYNEELQREIPDGWEVKKVYDIIDCYDSKRVPLSSKERNCMHGKIPYYGATGIIDYVNDYIFDGDYILLAEDGSVMTDNGYPIIQRISGKTWVNNHTHVIKPKSNYSIRLLIKILDRIPVKKIKTGSIQMKINQEKLNNYKILDIDDKIKKLANPIFDKLDEKIIHLENNNIVLKSFRDYLSPLLMNGQLIVK